MAELGASKSGTTRAVEIWHYRMFVFSATATLSLAVEISYTKLVPKIPQLYAALIRAAVWDCVLVGVIVAQLIDLAAIPLLAGIDSGHYLPLAVLLYHAIAFVFCGVYDLISQQGSGRARTLHRVLVSRRVLLELAGGTSGTKLYLGRVCFIVSGAAMWLALRVLLLLGEETLVLTCFIILLFVAYCAAGLAALEPRRSLPGHLVQWLCTGWGAREALLQGPLKILGGLLMLPFAASVIAAQIWLRTISFIVWLAVACPCCRLQRADNVFDAFERELAIPLLQCSFLAFSCTLAGLALEAELSSIQRMSVGIAATYYTVMLLIWTAPAVLQAKVAAEEVYDANSLLGEEGSVQLLERAGDGDVELEDLQSTCDELKALVQRERHDHAVEVGQLVAKLRDQEVISRSCEKSKVQLISEVEEWRERCSELKKQLAVSSRPDLPRLQWPAHLLNGTDDAGASGSGSQPSTALDQHDAAHAQSPGGASGGASGVALEPVPSDATESSQSDSEGPQPDPSASAAEDSDNAIESPGSRRPSDADKLPGGHEEHADEAAPAAPCSVPPEPPPPPPPDMEDMDVADARSVSDAGSAGKQDFHSEDGG